VGGWRLVPVAVAALAAAAAATVAAVAVNAATSGTTGWYRVVEQHPLWWTAGATAAVAAAGLLAWRAQGWYDRRLAELVPAVQRPEPWVVERPAEVGQVVAALHRKGGGTVGIATAVHGAGGFGKTTVAKIVRADPRVLSRFRGRVYWVTLGRDAGKEVLAGLVNGLIAQLEPDRAVTFTDARQAADHLAAILVRGPRRLLVLDDVWTEDQLSVFPVAGRCARLVTTRIPSLAVGTAVAVRVDEMSAAQARELLVAGLPPLPPAVIAGLLEETGQWPLLLRLVNKILAGQAGLHADVTSAAEELVGRLRAGGGLQVDELTGAAGQQLDVTDPVQRSKAVWATIQASTGLLGPAECERLAELAVFAEDEAIPVALITALWQATGGLNPVAAGALCARLADLALLTPAPGTGTVTMHDVIRDYHREELGAARLGQLHGTLLDTVAKNLPATPAMAGPGMVPAWWELPGQARYLREHLIEHMLAAGRNSQAEETAADLRWADARLRASGPAGPSADLALLGTPRAERLRQVLGQAAHLLAPTDPPHSLTDILYSRISHDLDWGPVANALALKRTLPALSSKWPPPDLPSPALRATITGHTGRVRAVGVAPGGSWLATASEDGTVRIWDAATGEHRATLVGHTDRVTAVAVAPNGTWLATASEDGTVRIWDAATGEHRATLVGHTDWVTAVAVAPNGTWLATTSGDKTVRIWDIATGEHRAIRTGHTSTVTSVAVAPDGTWLATASGDGTVRIWDTVTGERRAAVTGHTGWVYAVAVAPDGTWLATASCDKTVRIWDTATGEHRGTLAGHTGWVTSVAVAPDGTWLATASGDGTARIWDTTTRQPDAVQVKQAERMLAVDFAPDGTWLATVGEDGAVRIWDTVTGEHRAIRTGHTSTVTSVAVAPDGTWLATASHDKTVQIWDIVTGEHRAILVGHTDRVTAVAVAPNGTWLATASEDGTVRIWDAATGQYRATLVGHTDRVTAVAVAPDGTWLATASHDRTVRIWDTATREHRDTLAGWVTPTAVTPDGTWLTTAGSRELVRIWATITGRRHATPLRYGTLTGDTHWVTPVAVAPDGSWLAIASYDKTVRIWDTAAGQYRATLVGHTDRVTAVAVEPDGSWLATASADGTVRIWDAATGGIGAIMRVDSPLRDCAWSPSGRLLAATADAGIHLFAFNS
jgi:WD40 repeat protein